MTTATKVADLLPCPFCGPGESIVACCFDDVANRYRVYCGRCGSSTGIHPTDRTEAPAISAWNRRAALARQEAAPISVDRMAQIIRRLDSRQLTGAHEMAEAILAEVSIPAPPSAPVGQEAVAWRYWSPSGNCWWTRYVAPTEDTSPESTNWEPLYAAPPAAQTNPYEFAVDQCLVVAHLGIADPSHTREEAIRRLGQLIDFHVQVATDPRTNGGLSLQPAAQAVDLEQFRDCVIEAKEVWLQNAENWKGRSRESRYREWVDDCDRLLALIDQQAGKAGDA